MNFLNHMLKKHKQTVIAVLGVIALIVIYTMSQSQASFAPGTELDPNCEPGDAGCTVDVGGAGTLSDVLTAGDDGGGNDIQNIANIRDSLGKSFLNIQNKQVNDSTNVPVLDAAARQLNDTLGDPLVDWSTGNVGIGTASPGAKLQIKGDSSVNTDYALVAKDFGDGLIFRVENGGNVVVGNGSYSSTAEYNQFEVNKDISGDIGGQMVLTNYVAPAVGNAVSINSKVNTNFAGAFMSSRIETKSNGGNDNDLNFYLYDGSTPGGNLKLTIKNDGNVGIGTASPGQLLDVGDGTGQKIMRIHGGNAVANGGPALYLGYGGVLTQAIGAYSNIFGGAFNNSLTLYSVGSDILLDPNNGGKVGIGTATPGAKLTVDTGDVYINDNSRGVILRSPDNTCHRLAVSDANVVSASTVTCP